MAGEALSNGAILRVEAAGGGTFIAIGGVEGFTLPSVIREDISVTALDSTAQEYIAALPDTGESSFTVMARRGATAPNYEAGQERLEDLSLSAEIVDFQIVMPPSLGAITYTCAGYVKSFSPQLQTNDAVKIGVTIKWTGAVTKA